MEDFDPDKFLGQESQLASGSAAPDSASAPPDFDPDRFLNDGKAIDEITGEDIPVEFSGASPETAMNKSVVSAFDRFKLSMGNLEGNVKYLQSKFQDVKPIPNEPGELAVMAEGKWYRVDPKNGDIRDPWDLAKSYAKNPKELAGDLADLGPVGLGAGIAAAPAITGLAAGGSVVGAAALAGAATAATRTSLGRIVGTYDATPEQQTKDIAFETMLNAGGTKVLAGVKPTASWVAKRLGNLSKAFKDTVDDIAPEAVKATGRTVSKAGEASANLGKKAFKKVFAKFSVGEDNFDTAVQHPNKVASYMSRYDQRSGGKTSTYHDMIVQDQLKRVRYFAKNSRDTLTSIYGAMKAKVLSDVPNNFTANVDEILNTSYDDALKAGIGKIVVGEKELTGQAALDYVTEKGFAGAKFSLLSQKELAQTVKQTGQLGEQLGFLAQDKEAYDLVREFFNRIGVFSGAKNLGGKEGAKQLLDLKKNLSDISWSLVNSEKAQSVPAVKSLLDNSRTGMDKAIFNSLKSAGKGQTFTEMNATYSKLNSEFAPILSALNRYNKSGDLSAFQSLQSAFVARPGKQAARKFAIDAAIDAADAYGHRGLAKRLANDKLMFQVSEAARAFNPLPTQAGQFANSAGIGMGTYAAATGNVPLLGAIAASKTITSPTFAKGGVMLTQAMSKGQQWISSLPKSQLSQFMSNPEAMLKFTTAILQTPGIRSQVDQTLSQQIQGVTQ